MCGQDLEQHKKHELQQAVHDAEDQWMRLLQEAKSSRDGAEKQCALERQLRDHEAATEGTRVWLEDKQQHLDSLDCRKDPKDTMNTAQVSTNNRFNAILSTEQRLIKLFHPDHPELQARGRLQTD